MMSEGKTYYELVSDRNHARTIWHNMATSIGTDHEAMDNALDYLCQCQQRLEKRGGERMQTLKEKIELSRKIEKLANEWNNYSDAADRGGRFTEYNLRKAASILVEIDKLKEN